MPLAIQKYLVSSTPIVPDLEPSRQLEFNPDLAEVEATGPNNAAILFSERLAPTANGTHRLYVHALKYKVAELITGKTSRVQPRYVVDVLVKNGKRTASRVLNVLPFASWKREA